MHSTPQSLIKLRRPTTSSGWRPACAAPKRCSHRAVNAGAAQAGADMNSAADKDSILADLRAAFSLDAKPNSSTVGSTPTTQPATNSQQLPAAAAPQQRPAPVKKSKYRGRFANLLQSVEKDLLNGTIPSSSSSRASSGSRETAASSSNCTAAGDNSAPVAAAPSTSSVGADAAAPVNGEPAPRQRRKRLLRPLPPGPLTFAKLVLVEEEQRLNPHQDTQWLPQQTGQLSSAGSPRPGQQAGQSPQRQPMQQHEGDGNLQKQPAQGQRTQQEPQQPQQGSSAQHRPQKRQKEYKPVLKGNLQLPGGPQYSALRRHVVAAGTNPDLPTLDAIVIVEGDQDVVALACAVNAAAYVCDGTRAYKDHVLPELKVLAALGRELVVLTDPDERGRDLRAYLDDTIGPLQHAFVSEADATAAVDGPIHAAGNRGIEHAQPAVLQAALEAASCSFGAGRSKFTAEWAQAVGLANAFDADVAGRDDKAPERRRALCAALGLGQCTSAAMLSALNRYFRRERVEQALMTLSC